MFFDNLEPTETIQLAAIAAGVVCILVGARYLRRCVARWIARRHARVFLKRKIGVIPLHQHRRRLQRRRFVLALRQLWPGLSNGLVSAAVVVGVFIGATLSFERFAGSDLAGRVTKVRDGDTIEVVWRPIRFARLDCPEMNTMRGRQARQKMVSLVRGKRVSCRLTGRKSYDRYIGSCRLPDGRDLSQVMIRSGLCRRWARL